VKFGFESGLVGVGNEFVAEVLIENFPEFDSIGICVRFDPKVLECVSVDRCDFLSNFRILKKEMNNDKGIIYFGAGDLRKEGLISGSGKICRIKFRAKSKGQTKLSFVYDLKRARTTDALKLYRRISFIIKDAFVDVVGDSSTNFSITRTQNNLKKVRVYPNPCVLSRGAKFIIFDNLTEQADIYIYSISGDLLRTLKVRQSDNGRKIWDLTNSKENPVASGIYLYIIESGKGERSKGKIGIIR
jgi:hypothetical protein